MAEGKVRDSCGEALEGMRNRKICRWNAYIFQNHGYDIFGQMALLEALPGIKSLIKYS